MPHNGLAKDNLLNGKFENANRLYEKKEFEAAKEQYHELLNEGVLTPEVFLNIGNTWNKLSSSADAVIAYERGLLLAPSHRALKNNLQVTLNELNPDQPSQSKRSFLKFVPLSVWSTVLVTTLSLLFIIAGLSQFPSKHLKNLGRFIPLSFILSIIGVALFFFAYQEWTKEIGIVSQNDISARFGPVEEAEKSFTIEPGDYLSVIDERLGWVRVADSRNRTGWVKSEYFHFISPPERALNFSKLN